MTAPKLSGSTFNLLTPGNPKTVKGLKKGFWTFILHLAPANLSGFEMCPKRTAGCTAACLNLAGRGGIAAGGLLRHGDGRTNAVQEARIRRTQLYMNDRESFMADLIADILKAIRFCERHGYVPVFRLNGTSDIRWELASFMGFNLMRDLFPEIQFYDYTKLTNRRNVPANYHLTFSLAEGNDDDARAALAGGMNVAVVFRNKAVVAAQSSYLGAPVVNGDESDLRFLDGGDGQAVVVALYAKGPAKADRTGFVRD